jgi:hypothetical protein
MWPQQVPGPRAQPGTPPAAALIIMPRVVMTVGAAAMGGTGLPIAHDIQDARQSPLQHVDNCARCAVATWLRTGQGRRTIGPVGTVADLPVCGPDGLGRMTFAPTSRPPELGIVQV